MKILPDWVKNGYLRLVDPLAQWLSDRGVNPNTITTIGTLCSITGGVIYATGHIRAGGIFLGLTALFDVIDGLVARKSNRSTTFGAFYDSTLDRVADGAVMAGLVVFFATSPVHGSTTVLVITLAGLVGTFLVPYTRARAEALGLNGKVGLLQRPERVVLLSVPQALFGLALGGWILKSIIVLITVTAWITVWQRFRAVHAAAEESRMAESRAAEQRPAEGRAPGSHAREPQAAREQHVPRERRTEGDTHRASNFSSVSSSPVLKGD